MASLAHEGQSVANRDIVVIGGSSGATAPLKALLGALPREFPAAIFVVLHIPTRSLGMLATVTAAATQLPVSAAVEGMPIAPGMIYLGVPDRHLIIEKDRIRLGVGPRENMARPAIDPLFRSAALAYGPRVIGILLSGLLNDGTAGLEAIKRCGGLAMVQQPEDAIADEMPLSALSSVSVDLSIASARMGDVLAELVHSPAGQRGPAPPDIRLEVDIAAGARIDSGLTQSIGDPAPLTCPQCGGALSKVRQSSSLRFRCQVGHAFSAEALASEQEPCVDEALRVALRIIGERAELVGRMAEQAKAGGRNAIADLYQDRAKEYRDYADTIRKAVVRSMEPAAPSSEDGKRGFEEE